MTLRKINAVISLLITFFLLDHAIFISVWMLSKGSIGVSTNLIPWILTGLVLFHAFISIDVVISGIVNGNTQKGKKYFKNNMSTLIQRISGILMLIFTVLHIAGAMGYITPPKIVHAIIPSLFFAIVLSHVAISTSKAFITLGVGNVRFVKTIDIVVKVICVATYIAALTGFYLCRL